MLSSNISRHLTPCGRFLDYLTYRFLDLLASRLAIRLGQQHSARLLRRKRVVAVAVPLANPSIATVYDNFGSVSLSQLSGGLDCILLSAVDRSCSRVAFSPNSPLSIPRNYMYVSARHSKLIKVFLAGHDWCSIL